MNKTIWTPTGNYEINGDMIALSRCAREYDPMLSVGKNPLTGDICLFREQPDGSKRPLYGWQRTPSTEELLERMYKTDTWKHGDKILDDAFKRAAKVREDARKETDEQVDAATEEMAFYLRRV